MFDADLALCAIRRAVMGGHNIGCAGQPFLIMCESLDVVGGEVLRSVGVGVP